MEKNIHPKVYPVVLAYTNGKKVNTVSVLGKHGEVVELNAGDWPPETHRAWTKSMSTNIKSTTKIKKFQDKFGGNLFSTS